MSKPGPAPQAAAPRPPGGPGTRRRIRIHRPWHRGGTGLRAAAAILLFLVVLPVLLAAVVLIRLCDGPLEVSALARHLLPTRLAGGTLRPGRAWLSVRLREPGIGPTLRLQLSGYTVRAPDGQVLDRVGDLRATVAAVPLLSGRLRPLDLALSDSTLRITRDPRGISLGGAFPASPRHPPFRHPATRTSPVPDWSALRALQLSDVAVVVHDRILDRDWSVRSSSAVLHRAPGGVSGRIDAAADLPGQPVALHATGASAPDGTLAWHLATTVLTPAALAAFSSSLRALAVPVTTDLTVVFTGTSGHFMDPLRATAVLGIGPGTLDTGRSLLAVQAGTLDVAASLSGSAADPGHRAAHLTLDRFSVTFAPPAPFQPPGVADVAFPSPASPPAASGPGPTPRPVSPRPAAAAPPVAPPPAIPAAGPTAGPTLSATGTADLDDLLAARRIRIVLAVRSTPLDFATLADEWPVGVAKGARRWILANITAGRAENLEVETRLESDAGWNALTESSRSGAFDAHDLTLWWLRPIPPLRHMEARLVFDGPDAVQIDATDAVMPVDPNGPLRRPATLAVHPSSMRITGLNAHDQIGTVAIHLSGTVSALLGELAHPRLHLLSRHPLPFTDPSGHTDTRFTVVLPLDSHVTTDQIRLRVADHLTDLHLGDVVAGRPLDRGDLRLAVDNDGLSLSGHAVLLGLPAALRYGMDFRSGPPEQVTTRATLSAALTPATLAAEGLDPRNNLSGSAVLAVDYAAHRNGEAEVNLGLDMAALGVSTAVWNKAPGVPATAQATISLLKGHLRAIDDMRAEGPGLAIQARTELRDGHPRRVVVGSFRVGRSTGSGSIALPSPARPGVPPAPIRVTAQGTALDLSPVFDAKPRPPSSPGRTGDRGAGTPWSAALHFDRVYVGPERSVSNVRAVLHDDGRRIEQVRLDADGPTAVSVRLDPRPGGRSLSGQVADTGRLLSALGITNAFSGGQLTVSGRFDDRAPSSALSGTLAIGPFIMPDAPRLARLARNATLYGWLLAPPSPALRIDAVTVPFVFADGRLLVHDARVHDPALGATARGTIDTANDTVAIDGTLVPAWAINHLPGELPVVGHLFSPEKGGGLFAASYSVSGPLRDPHVTVNPWSLLLPGALRRLLPP